MKEILFSAFANICLFLGFGLMALARAFDYYMENHIPYLEENKIT